MVSININKRIKKIDKSIICSQNRVTTCGQNIVKLLLMHALIIPFIICLLNNMLITHESRS